MYEKRPGRSTADIAALLAIRISRLRRRGARLSNRFLLVFPNMRCFRRVAIRRRRYGGSRPLRRPAIARGRPLMNDLRRIILAGDQQIDRVDGVIDVNRLDQKGARGRKSIGIRQTVKVTTQEDNR
jgi:hypothetical protein